ncbi:MAG: YqaJ viral recombinase family protein [Clostridia bacterium]|nr:YqaJ viral recombinase family protein [Clostridia bacterium]
MSLELLQIEHNSPEWLAFRRTGIGGSDAAAILGKSHFKTNVKVWEEKTGLIEPDDISDKEQVKYGKAVEDLLLQMFALDNPEYEVTSNKKIVYRRGFMFASLDGELVEKATGELGIYEGKTAEIHKKIELEKWNKRVPDYYYVQILHYLIVTGRSFVVLKVQLKLLYTEEKTTMTKQYRFNRKDLLNDLAYLYRKEAAFWDSVLAGVKPPRILPEF